MWLANRVANQDLTQFLTYTIGVGQELNHAKVSTDYTPYFWPFSGVWAMNSILAFFTEILKLG